MDIIENTFGKERLEKNIDRIIRFWNGEERIMVSVNSSKSRCRQIFDTEKLLTQTAENLQDQASLPGCNIPAFFPDFGTVSTAKYWGGKTFFPTEESTDIFIQPVAQSIDEALLLDPLPADNPTMDAAKAIELFRKISERMNTDKLWMRTPDMQGTLNTAGLVMNQEEFLMAMYTEPEKVHLFLEKTNGFLIEYARFLIENSSGRICGNLWPYVFFPPELGLGFTEDLMPLLSPELYKEFGIPYVEKLSESFGGCLIHCCGDWGRHAENLSNSKANIKGIEFHCPFTKIEELEPLFKKDTVLIPYIALDREGVEFTSRSQYYQWLIESTDESVRFWFAFHDEEKDAVEFAKKYGF